MNAHDITERTRLLHHQHYAEMIKQDPEIINKAREHIADHIATHGGTGGQRLWALILQHCHQEICQRMIDDGSEGRLLRSNSPFAILIGITDPEERRRLWRQAKKELSDQTISSEPSAA